MKSLKLKYNYVIIGAEDYDWYGFSDIIQQKNTYCYHSRGMFEGPFLRHLFRINFSKFVNKYVDTPLSWLINSRLYPHKFDNDKPICFFFLGRVAYVYQSSYIDYLRKTHPDAKFVLYMEDLVGRNINLDIRIASKKMDLILSYDQGDCNRYGLIFHQTPMSYVAVNDNSSITASDVYFCGSAKERYLKVYEVYNFLKDKGFICDFHLVGLPPNAPKLAGICYHEKKIDYIENLQHIEKTKCILEVMQDGADGFTPRLWESIVYEKHLITNNHALQNSPFYKKEGMHMLNDILEDNSLKPFNKINYQQEFRDLLSPLSLFSFIDNKLI